MKKQINKKTILGIISICLTSFLLGAVFVNAQVVSQTHIISAGVYPGAPSYTVWTDNAGNYYAKNSYGVLTYSTTNASYLFNSLQATGTTFYIQKGTYDITNSITILYDHVKIQGEQRGAVILSWSGAAGGSVITTGETPFIYDLTIEDLDFQTHDLGDAIYLKPALRFTIRDINIAGGTTANTYSGIVLDATYGNCGWGKIDNVMMDYVYYGINFFGTDATHATVDIHIGAVFATHIMAYGLRFAAWTDTIDVDYGFFEAGTNNVSAAVFNDLAPITNDNGVYDIHINRLIFDNWHYSGTKTIYINNAKQIIIDSAFKGNATDSIGTVSDYATGIYIIQQGQENGSNGIIIYSRNVTSTGI